jgi:hypothetical protein
LLELARAKVEGKVKVYESREDRVVSLLKAHRFQALDEATVQRSIADVLTNDGLYFEREVRLTERDRIDFQVGLVGIEVKVQGTAKSILQQLTRYAKTGKLSSLILVTTMRKHGVIETLWNPRSIPLKVVILGGGLI